MSMVSNGMFSALSNRDEAGRSVSAFAVHYHSHKNAVFKIRSKKKKRFRLYSNLEVDFIYIFRCSVRIGKRRKE